MDGQSPTNHSSQNNNQNQPAQNENDAPQVSPRSIVAPPGPLTSLAYTPPRPPPRALKRKSPHEHTDSPTPPLSGPFQQILTSPERAILPGSLQPPSSASPTSMTTPTRTLAHRPIAKMRGSSRSPANLASPASPHTPTSASRLPRQATPVNENMVQATTSYTPMQLDTMAYVSPDARKKADDAAFAALRAGDVASLERGGVSIRISPHHGKKADEQQDAKNTKGRADSAEAPEA